MYGAIIIEIIGTRRDQQVLKPKVHGGKTNQSRAP